MNDEWERKNVYSDTYFFNFIPRRVSFRRKKKEEAASKKEDAGKGVVKKEEKVRLTFACMF